MGWLQLGRRSDLQSPTTKPIHDAQQQHQSHQTPTSSTYVEHVESIKGSSPTVSLCNFPPISQIQIPAQNPHNHERPSSSSPSSSSTTTLPFIPASLITTKRQPNLILNSTSTSPTPQELWLVIDNIVYDCTSFLHSHPGGRQVLVSFAGEDCSWQFWRFHPAEVMEGVGSGLRIGWTRGVENRFVERERFVGLRRLGGGDEW